MTNPADQTLRIELNDDGAGEAWFVEIEGPEPGKRTRLSDRADIGRLSSNDIVLDSAGVSKHHARCERIGAGYWIRDCDSTNGVMINGTALERGEKIPLCHGDTIGIADVLILFVHRGTFEDDDGGSSVRIDKDKVSKEADAFLRELGWDSDSKGS